MKNTGLFVVLIILMIITAMEIGWCQDREKIGQICRTTHTLKIKENETFYCVKVDTK